MANLQDKNKETAFFDGYGESGYNAFTDSGNCRLIDTFIRLSSLPAGSRVADLGCGSGVFTHLLRERGYQTVGVDLSPRLAGAARRQHDGIAFLAGDVERLPFPAQSFDGVLLSGILHHLPDAARSAHEVNRILKPGGRFVAFDPNRRNPFMWLYRDRSSPFYSSAGVTANERPVLAEELVRAFVGAGLRAQTEYLDNLSYRYVASPAARLALPVYNFLDRLLFRPAMMERYRSFVLTFGSRE